MEKNYELHLPPNPGFPLPELPPSHESEDRLPEQGLPLELRFVGFILFIAEFFVLLCNDIHIRR